jgi:hypothetical protein
MYLRDNVLQCCSRQSDARLSPRHARLQTGRPDQVEGASKNQELQPGGFAERRGNMRYPCRLCLSWRTIDPPLTRGESCIGTLNISSKGLLFSALEQFERGRLLEVTLDWPARLNGQIPLKLVVLGHVLRSSEGYTAMSIHQYEFRTRANAAISLLQGAPSYAQSFEVGSVAHGSPSSTERRIVWRRKIHLPAR